MSTLGQPHWCPAAQGKDHLLGVLLWSLGAPRPIFLRGAKEIKEPSAWPCEAHDPPSFSPSRKNSGPGVPFHPSSSSPPLVLLVRLPASPLARRHFVPVGRRVMWPMETPLSPRVALLLLHFAPSFFLLPPLPIHPAFHHFPLTLVPSSVRTASTA